MADGLLSRAPTYILDRCLFAFVALMARYSKTLTGTTALDGTYPNVLRFNPNGVTKIVTLDAEANAVNATRLILNTGTVGDLTVNSDAPALITTITPGNWAELHCDGVSWVLVRAGDSSALAQYVPETAGAGAALELPESTGGGASTFRIQAPATLGGDRVLEFPDHDVTWGTFPDNELKITDNSTPTKILTFQLSGITAGQTRVMSILDRDWTPGAYRASEFRINDTADPTKATAFDVSAVTPGQTRTVTMPDAAVALGNIAVNTADFADLNISTAIAAGASLTNSNAETSLGNYQIAANKLVAGTRVRIRYGGRVTANNGATTLTIRVRLGGLAGVAILTTTAVDTGAGDIFEGEIELVARAAPGGAVAISGVGAYCNPGAPGTAARLSWMYTPANYATNAAIDLDISGQWSAADANACQLEHLTVEYQKAA